MGWTATAEVLDQGAPARGPANDNAVPGGRVAWYRNYHRYYDPAVGRYTQVEPAMCTGCGDSGAVTYPRGYTGELPYGYAENDPLLLVDPDGLQAEQASRWAWWLWPVAVTSAMTAWLTAHPPRQICDPWPKSKEPPTCLVRCRDRNGSPVPGGAGIIPGVKTPQQCQNASDRWQRIFNRLYGGGVRCYPLFGPIPGA